MEVGKSIELPTLLLLYQDRITGFRSAKEKLEKESRQIVAGRLVMFILIAVMVYLSAKLKSEIILVSAVPLLAGFLFLVKRAVDIHRKLNYFKILIEINENEISALNHDHSAFDPGSDYIDYQHEYCFDLDIFGEHSIFRLLNRAATPPGRKKLADRLLYPGTDGNQIRFRQEAAKEMAGKVSWRQDFLATARESEWEGDHNRNVISWLMAPDKFSHTPIYMIAVWINSIIALTLPVLFALVPSIPPTVFVYYLIPVGLIVSRTRLINREQEKLERLLDLFRKYGGLLTLIEKEDFKSPYLNKLKSALEFGNVPSSQIMKNLYKILWGLEVRGNLIVSFFLNAFFLWDILLMIRLERWRRKYNDAFGKWIDTIAEFETINSIANLAFNRPDLTWPDILAGSFRMHIADGGHPLINPSRRVDNSLNFSENGCMYLITGANMAGKSTLLRMVGVNMILAMAGGPVCAARFSMVPVTVFTSVRTNDSLGDDESYFYAELKKLSRIITRLEKGEQLFVIIDEMLKGTNSHDKHTGSAALIHRLTELGTSGLLATHDIALGELEKEYPGRLFNRCFEVMIENDLLTFDYRLYPGVSKNLNATFLMKKMGIIRK